MKVLTATVLALALTATAGTASAQYSNYPSTYGNNQNYGSNQNYNGDTNAVYDYARVVRVVPVYDTYNNGRYVASTGGQRCSESRTYAGNGYNNAGYGGNGYSNNGYSNDGYNNGGYNNGYGNDGYNNGYGNNGYNDGYARPQSQVGSTVATVIGGLVGAAVGSQVGGGSARYATSALGSMVGGMAGRSVYQHSRAPQPVYRQRVGTVVACDPVQAGSYGTARGATMYDVTYEYRGRNYTTRTATRPGDRIRVRVDVSPE